MASSSPTTPTPSPLGRNPLPVSARQEAQIRDIFYKRARRACADEIRLFAECASTRTITMVTACRPLRLAMNNCMVAYDNQEERDRAREEWFATIDQRKAELADKERKKLENQALRRRIYGVSEPGDEEILKNVKS